MCINTINSNISNRKRNSLKAETEKAIATTSTASAGTTKSSKTASPALDVAQVEVVVYSAAFVPVVVAVSDAESVTAEASCDTRSILCCVEIVGASAVQCRLILSHLTCCGSK